MLPPLSALFGRTREPRGWKYLFSCEVWIMDRSPQPMGFQEEHKDADWRWINADDNMRLDVVNQPGLCDLSHSDINQCQQRLRGDSGSACVLGLHLRCLVVLQIPPVCHKSRASSLRDGRERTPQKWIVWKPDVNTCSWQRMWFCSLSSARESCAERYSMDFCENNLALQFFFLTQFES